MRLTKTVMNKITQPASGQAFYRDDQLKGFALRITASGVRSFIVEKRVDGKVKRMTLGRYPDLTVEQARREAQKLLGKIATGIDPVAEKKEKLTKKLTLQNAFDDYLSARKNLKSNTIKDYRQVLNEVVPDWLNKPLLSISKDKISKRHTEHGEKRSQARANYAMRLLRAIFNFSQGEYEDAKGCSIILENPVKRLSHTRAWYRVDRRQTVIKSHELIDWYEGLKKLTSERNVQQAEMMKDYFLLILLTGLRRREAASLKWSAIDFKAKTLTVSDTKNHLIHVLPLSDFLLELFKRRKEYVISDFVFPSNSQSGYLTDPKKAMLKMRALSGIHFTLHDLRRTFITIAESLDIPVYALKRLLNHKMKNDVTAGYVIIDVERLRKPMQMITDYLLRAMGVKINNEIACLKQSGVEIIS